MARQITILDTKKTRDGINTVTGAFWFQISPASAQVPKPQFVSVLVGVTGANVITSTEQAALESGAIREEAFSIDVSSSTTMNQAKANLEQRWIDRNTAVQAEPPTRQLYGLTFNGTTWA